MRKWLIWTIIFVFILTLPCFAQSKARKGLTPPSVSELQNVGCFIDFKDIKAGEIGYGLSVFRGIEPLVFKVKAEKTFPNIFFANDRYPDILVADFPYNYTAIRGMSGSPIYFQKKNKWCLAGSLSYALSWNKLPTTSDSNLIGITPIKGMLEQKIIFGSSPQVSKRSAKFHLPKPGEMVIFNFTSRVPFACTVTYVDRTKNRFYICGHSIPKILAPGKVALPAYQGEVITSIKGKLDGEKVVREMNSSYVGMIDYNNPYALEGEIGRIPPSGHLTITLATPSSSATHQIEYAPVVTSWIFLAQEIAGFVEPYLPATDEKTTFDIRGEIIIPGATKLNMYSTFVAFGENGGVQETIRFILNYSDLVRKIVNSGWNFTVPTGAIEIKKLPGNQFLYYHENENKYELENLAEGKYLIKLVLSNAEGNKKKPTKINIETTDKDKLKNYQKIEAIVYSGDQRRFVDLGDGTAIDDALETLSSIFGLPPVSDLNAKPDEFPERESSQKFLKNLEDSVKYQRSLDQIYVAVVGTNATQTTVVMPEAVIPLPKDYYLKGLLLRIPLEEHKKIEWKNPFGYFGTMGMPFLSK